MKYKLFAFIILSYSFVNNVYAAFLEEGDILNFTFDQSDLIFEQDSDSMSAHLFLRAGYVPISLSYDPEIDAFVQVTNPEAESKKFKQGESVAIRFFEDTNFSVPGLVNSSTIEGNELGEVNHLSILNVDYFSGVIESMWTDLNGSFSVVMLSGDVEINYLQLTIHDGSEEYSATLYPSPVPLPTSLVLYMSGLSFLFFRVKKRITQ